MAPNVGYIDGKKHRDNDKPAVVYADGSQCWYINGKWHRDGGKPASVHANGELFIINHIINNDQFV